LDDVLELFQPLQVKAQIVDERFDGALLDVSFCGTLRIEKQQAAEVLLRYDTGVLAASTAFSKTVVAAYLIAQHKVNTLVVVHRRQLLDQWIEMLIKFLNIKDIGQIGGGKRKTTGKIDVAMVQSLYDKGEVNDLVGNYGHLIVDECHHISAVSFEQVVRQSKARYITGLSATVVRRDGHHPIIFMQCGSVRHRVDDRKQAEVRPFDHKVIVRPTTFHLPQSIEKTTTQHIHDLYALLAMDGGRNRMIVEDVLAAIRSNRSPVLLTERRDHLDLLAGLLSPHVQNIINLWCQFYRLNGAREKCTQPSSSAWMPSHWTSR
jgi:superfamily II DNA or RNA helicase